MKIDTHQHYWRYEPQAFPWISEGMPTLRRDRLPADCAPALQVAGVDGVMAVQARCSVEETEFLLALAAEHNQIVGVVGWVDLMAPDLDLQLDRWHPQLALRGFRHLLQDEPDVVGMVTHPLFNQGIASLQARQWVYDVLVFDHQMPAMPAFCARHDAHWLVLDHVAKPAVRDWVAGAEVSARWVSSLRELAAMPHVMCKLSGLVTETDWSLNQGISPAAANLILRCFDQALEVFGPKRLMFGSDWPVCELAASFDWVHALAQTWAESRLSPQEQADFWSGNAIRCYGLNLEALPA